MAGRRDHPNTKEGRSHYSSPLDDNFPHPKKRMKMHILLFCQGFGEDINCQLLSRTILQRKNTIGDKTLNIMSIKVEMIFLGVIYRIISKLNCTLILTFQHSRQFWNQDKLSKNMS